MDLENDPHNHSTLLVNLINEMRVSIQDMQSTLQVQSKEMTECKIEQEKVVEQQRIMISEQGKGPFNNYVMLKW